MSARREILIATAPFAGHTTPLLPIARELVARGHGVRWFSGRMLESAINDTGATFESLPAGIDHSVASLDELFPEREHLRGLASLRFDLRSLFIDPIPEQAAGLHRLHSERPADLVLYDVGFGGALVFSSQTGIVSASVGVSPMLLSSPYVAPFGLGWQPGEGALFRVRNKAMDAAMTHVLLRSVHRRVRVLERELGVKAPKGLTLSPYLHLQAGVLSFEHPRPDLPPQVHFVGVLDEPSHNIDVPAWWPDVLAPPGPVVHVTQGTVANRDLRDLVIPTVQALAGMDALTVVSTRRAGQLDQHELPLNARTASFLPYNELLPHVTVMVTNGGFGGVQQALSYGIPLVVAAGSEDKPEVAARVARSGVGINLRTGRPSREAVLAAVRKVLAEPRYRAAARALSRDYRSVDPAAASADLIEDLLFRGPHPEAARARR